MVNGKTVTAQATFNVIKPTVDWIGNLTGAVAVDTNYDIDNTPYPPGLTWLHLGESLNAENDLTLGITFTATNFNFNGYTDMDNSLYCVQLVTTGQVEHCSTNGTTLHQSGYGLDTVFPYENLDGALLTDSEASTKDAPATSCLYADQHIADADVFQMYLMFQADGVKSIPVPLKMISWNWSGSGNIVTYKQWNLISSNANITANNQLPVAFPQWSQNATNYTYITNTICN
jgi:hypothetical protein